MTPSVTTTSTSTVTQTTTTKSSSSACTLSPDIDKGKPYDVIAASLPAPSEIIPKAWQTPATPAVKTQYSIPDDSFTGEQLPFNSKGLGWRSWRSKFTTISSLYVLGARHYEQRSNESNQRAVHAMFSPPQADLQNSNAVEGWRAKATEIAEDHGIRGGMCVFHGFRVQPKVSEKFKSLIEGTEFDETATDVLLWEWIRRDDWRKYATWGPHFHIVGLARENEDAVDEYKGEGVFQRLREFDAYETSNNMTAVAEHRSVAKDIMDHASFKNSDALPPISWFGDLEGQSWSSAKQYVTDSKLNSLRGKLINGPAKVE